MNLHSRSLCGCEVSILKHIQKLPQYNPVQTALVIPAWVKEVDKMISGGPFQPQSFSNSVILWVLPLVHAKRSYMTAHNEYQ